MSLPGDPRKTFALHWIPSDRKEKVKVETVAELPAFQDVAKWVSEGRKQRPGTPVYLERVNVLVNDKAEAMYVDEEGNTHWKQLPCNERATEHYHRFSIEKRGIIPPSDIHGRALLIIGGDFD